MTLSRCKTPLAPALLADYWLEELASTDEERVEEHLFACAECSGELEGLVEIIEVIRDLTRKGAVGVVLSEPFLERLRREGLSVRQYRVDPGGGVACTITPQDDLVISRFAADLSGAKRVDISSCDAEGNEQARVCDVPLTRMRDEVVFSQSTDALRALGRERLRVRLIAVDDTEERLLGEYTFDHTPSRA
jgi:hypothetical protein